MTVEFAICASVFFLFIFAAMEFSRYFLVQHAIQMVAYESARAGIVPGATRDRVQTRADNLLQACGVPNATIDITPEAIDATTREVTVTVAANFNENSWIPPTFLSNRTLEYAITLQHENNAYLDPEDTDVGELIGNNDSEPIDE